MNLISKILGRRSGSSPGNDNVSNSPTPEHAKTERPHDGGPEVEAQDVSSTDRSPGAVTPRPLRNPTDEPATFPVDALGAVGKPAAEAVAEITQAPLTICGHATLFAMTAAVQARADVMMPFLQPVPLSQYIIDIGESSERKTTVVSHLCAFLTRHEEMLEETFRVEHADFLKASNGDDDPGAQEPLKPEYIVQEPTYEGLLKVLHQGHGSAVLLNDDAGDFISGHAMSAENRLKTAAGISRLWSGQPVKRPRVSESVNVRYKRLSMYLLLQGKAADRLLGDDLLQDQGFLSRIPVTWPTSNIGTRGFRLPTDEARKAAAAFNETMLSIISQPVSYRPGSRNDLELRPLPFSAKALNPWVAFHDDVEFGAAHGAKYESLRGFAGKMAENVGRMAGVLTLASDVNASEISKEAVEAAIALGEFHLAEKRRLIGVRAADARTEAAALVLDWLNDRWTERYVARSDILQRGPGRLRSNKEAVTAAIECLVEKGWLRPVEGGAKVKGKLRTEAWERTTWPSE